MKGHGILIQVLDYCTDKEKVRQIDIQSIVPLIVRGRKFETCSYYLNFHELNKTSSDIKLKFF